MNGSVSLYDESSNQIKVLPLPHLPVDKFALVLNSNSFPEIGKTL
jgi:hypothetical protein